MLIVPPLGERGIFYGSIGIGVVIGAILCYQAYASVTNHEVMLRCTSQQFLLSPLIPPWLNLL